METATIRATIAAIRADADKSSLRNLKSKYFQFYENNPRLFEAAANTAFPLTYIETMLAEIDKLNNKTTDMDTADKNIYGQLRSVYVDPLINTDGQVSTSAPSDLQGAGAPDAL